MFRTSLKTSLVGTLAVVALLFTQSANAGITASPFVGASIMAGSGSSDVNNFSPQFGAELSYRLLGTAEVGAYFSYNILTAAISTVDGGNVLQYGGLARVTFPVVGIFVDAKVGSGSKTLASVSSDGVLAYGMGIGKKFGLGPFLDIRPRLGAQFIPLTYSGVSAGMLTSVDISIMASLSFF